MVQCPVRVLFRKSTLAAMAFPFMLALALSLLLTPPSLEADGSSGYIKWVDFSIPEKVLARALEYDLASYETDKHIDWIDILSYLGAKYGGVFSRYKNSDMDSFVEKLKAGQSVEELTAGMKFFSYYRKAYGAVLGGFVGLYRMERVDENGNKRWEVHYGLKVFLPIAKGFGFSHYDDFGDGRTYGFRRKHLGNDLLGGIGTPVVAVETGVVEAMGWNRYGGWRIGIRSMDRQRYYYYAHLRKDRPFAEGLKEGQVVQAGDVIGYLGMTGYSYKENVNNIKTPHLHFGLQLIFDESQKDGVNQIWVDVYSIVELLKRNRSVVERIPDTREYRRVYGFEDLTE